MNSFHLAVPAALALASGSTSPPAQSAQIERTELSRNDIGTAGREALQVLVAFTPGAVAPRHWHPGEELVYVVTGSLQYRLDGRPAVTLRAGETLFIPRGVAHEVTNVGSDRAAELATYIVEKGQPLVVTPK